jgi:hypothetical protein
MSIKGKAYIAGIYEHPTRLAKDKSVAQLHAECALGALADATVDRAGAPPRLAAQLLKIRGAVAYYRNHLADATALLTKARERYVALSSEGDVADVETLLGATARAAGDLDTAERHHRAALAIDQKRRGPDHPDVSRDLHNLAGVLRRLARRSRR